MEPQGWTSVGKHKTLFFFLIWTLYRVESKVRELHFVFKLIDKFGIALSIKPGINQFPI
jgi:hypothetical protein